MQRPTHLPVDHGKLDRDSGSMEIMLLCHHPIATSARHHAPPMVRRRIHREGVMEYEKPPVNDRWRQKEYPERHSVADPGPTSTRSHHHGGSGYCQSAHQGQLIGRAPPADHTTGQRHHSPPLKIIIVCPPISAKRVAGIATGGASNFFKLYLPTSPTLDKAAPVATFTPPDLGKCVKQLANRELSVGFF